MRSIAPVQSKVALIASDEAQSFCFSRTWTVLRTVLHLASRRLALRNLTYLIAHDDLACEDLFIGLPVLQHLKVDSKILLESNRASLDGTDCTLIPHSTAPVRGVVSRLMISGMSRLPGNGLRRDSAHFSQRVHVNYFTVRTEEDPFPDPSVLDLFGTEQHDTICAAFIQLSKMARNNVVPEEDGSTPDKILCNNLDVF